MAYFLYIDNLISVQRKLKFFDNSLALHKRRTRPKVLWIHPPMNSKFKISRKWTHSLNFDLNICMDYSYILFCRKRLEFTAEAMSTCRINGPYADTWTPSAPILYQLVDYDSAILRSNFIIPLEIFNFFL